MWSRIVATLPERVEVGVDPALHPQEFRHVDAGEDASAETRHGRRQPQHQIAHLQFNRSLILR